MNTALWVAQGWLAAVFLVAGGVKLAQPKAALERRPGMAYAAEWSPAALKLVGLAEVVGAVGLVLPWLLRRMPVLTPVAAACLAVLMLGAVAVHVRRREPSVLPAGLFVVAALVAVGRSGLVR